jgi:hypothetical protein
MANLPLIYRQVKGTPLTFAQGDNNIRLLYSGSVESITFDSSSNSIVLERYGSSLAPNILVNLSGSSVLSSSFALTASIASRATTSSFSLTASLARTASFVATASWANLATQAVTASYINLIAGPGVSINRSTNTSSINELIITASLRTVNGVVPGNDGNVAISLTGTITGTSASLVDSSSGAITSSIQNGTLWVISGDPTGSINGQSYIFISASSGSWQPLAPSDQAANDARYLMLTPQAQLSGSLSLGGFRITNLQDASASADAVSLGYLTSSLLQYVSYSAFNEWTGSNTSSFAGTSSYALTASLADTASQAITASYVDLVGNGVTINYSGSQIQLTASAGGATVTVSDTQPTTVISGSLWWNTTDANMYIYYTYVSGTTSGSAWVPATSLVVEAATADTASVAISASYALTASYAENVPETASYALTSSIALTSSLAETASYAFTSSFAETASFVATASYALTASFVSTSSYALTASYVETSSYALTASLADLAITASYIDTASWALNAVTSSYIKIAETASYIDTASWALNAVTSSYIKLAESASYIDTASWALNSISASYVNLTSSNIVINYNSAIGQIELTGSSEPFPYTGSAIISGSLQTTGSINITGSLILNGVEVPTTQGFFTDAEFGEVEPSSSGNWRLYPSASNLYFQYWLTGSNEWNTDSFFTPEGLYPSASIAETASYALTASLARTASYVNLVGKDIVVNYKPNGLIELTGSTGGGGGATVTVDANPPGIATSGSLWWDTTNANLYIYYQYVSASVSGAVWTPATSLVLQAAAANTASYAQYAETAMSSSFALTASYIDGLITSASYSSFAETASYLSGTIESASYALTASYISGSSETSSYALTASYVQQAQSASYYLMENWATNNFVDDAAAAAAGVPLGGIYRTGNIIVVRIS